MHERRRVAARRAPRARDDAARCARLARRGRRARPRRSRSRRARRASGSSRTSSGSGCAQRFALVACFGDGLAGKPAPDTYLAACAAIGVEPRAAIAIEDSPHGVTAAKAAGLWCIAVPHEITERLDLSHADLRLPLARRRDVARSARPLARVRSRPFAIGQQRPPHGPLPCHW